MILSVLWDFPLIQLTFLFPYMCIDTFLMRQLFASLFMAAYRQTPSQTDSKKTIIYHG